MILFTISLLFINLMFFFLIGIGGMSMASVEGVAAPWLHIILYFWICAHIPYLFYITNLIKNKKDKNKLLATKRSIASSAWLAFPGGIAIFMFIGSKIPWAAMIFPIIQTIVGVYVYLKNK